MGSSRSSSSSMSRRKSTESGSSSIRPSSIEVAHARGFRARDNHCAKRVFCLIIMRDSLNILQLHRPVERFGVFHVEDDMNAHDDGFADSSRLLSPLEASQLLTDEYSAKILLATYKRKISAQEISQRYGIPIAACYRKIRILEEVGLIQCVERILTQKGKRKNLYTSCLRNAYIFFENGKLRARFQLATGQVKDFGGDWNGLDLMKQ